MDNFISEGVGDAEGAAIDHRSCGGCNDGLDVAGISANLLKKGLPGLRVRGFGEGGGARWDFFAADEIREVVDVGQAPIVGNIFRGLRGLSGRGGGLWAPSS